MSAPGGVLEHVGKQEDQNQKEDHAKGENRTADVEFRAQDLKQGGLGRDLLAAYCFIFRVKEVGRQNDLPHAERDDERGQFHHGDQPAVDRSDQRAEAKAARNRETRRQTVAEGKLTHHHRRDDGDCADAEVNARGQNDKALRCGDDPDDLHLLQDERQREGRELGPQQHPENNDRGQKDDQRDECRRHMQGVMDLSDKSG